MKKEIAVLVLLVVSAGFVFGSGGKVRSENPIITEDGCVLSIPEGIDTKDCQLIPAADQSGVKVWFCDQYPVDATVVCED